MGELTWSRVADGEDGLRYRIRRNADGATTPWRLETARRGAASTRIWIAHSHHPSRRRARARAGDLEKARVKRVRVLVHGLVGVAAAAVFAAGAASLNGLLTFVVTMTALYLALRSFVTAIAVWLSDAWGWTRDGGISWRPGRLEAFLLDLADKRQMELIQSPSAGASSPVRVLPPG